MDEKQWEKNELILHSKKSIGKKIKDLVNPEHVIEYYKNPKNKGWIGNSIESDYFLLPNNNRHEADFANIGVELKVTPIKHTKRGWSAKERLVLNIFDFNDEYKRTFENASFMEKASLMELIQYEFQKNIPSPELEIKAATFLDLHELPEEDLLIIKNDWNIIIDKIKQGKAEELSESLTQYLGAAPKGSKSEKNMTTQPFSDIKAHRRAFSLKSTYMTQLTRQILDGSFQSSHDNAVLNKSHIAEPSKEYVTNEHIIKNINQLKKYSLEEIIIQKFQPYFGKTKTELAQILNINIPEKDDKASTALIAKRILNLNTDIQNTDEFLKSGLIMKTIVANSKKHSIKENFKLFTVNFQDIIDNNWEDSEFRDFLLSHRFMLVIYDQTDTDMIFKGIKFWNVPYTDIEEVAREMWLMLKNIISQGVTLTYTPANTKKGYIIKNNLPSIKDNSMAHIRPNARKSSYRNDNNTVKMPYKHQWINRPDHLIDELSDEYMTKQAYWLNAQYMYKQIKDIL